MTVKELIEILKSMPQDAEVGVLGHYGEFHAMDQFDFRAHKFGLETLLIVTPPDIGPEPD